MLVSTLTCHTNDSSCLQEILSQVSLLNLDTGVRVTLSDAPAISPNPLNPLSLQIMKLTNR